MEITKQFLEKLLDTGECICLKCGSISKIDDPRCCKPKKGNDKELVSKIRNLVLTGDCYPRKFFRVFRLSSAAQLKETLKIKENLSEMYKDEIKEQIKSTLMKNYGVETTFYSPEIRKKIEATNMEKFGNTHAASSAEVRKKIEATNMERFGVKQPFKSRAIQDKVSKTNLEKLGVEKPFQSKAIQDKVKAKIPETMVKYRKTISSRYQVPSVMQVASIKQKHAETCMMNFGVDHPFKSKVVREKITQTFIENYGEDNPFKAPEIQYKCRPSSLTLEEFTEQWNKRASMLDELREAWKNGDVGEDTVVKFLHENFSYTIARAKASEMGIDVDRYSLPERIIKEYLDELKASKIIENFEPHKRPQFLGRQELDFLIPINDKFSLAIEVNGVYYHSSNKALFKNKPKDKFYHVGKRVLCQQNGVRLLSYMDFEINDPEKIEGIKEEILNAILEPWDDEKLAIMRESKIEDYTITKFDYKGWEYWDCGRYNK